MTNEQKENSLFTQIKLLNRLVELIEISEKT